MSRPTYNATVLVLRRTKLGESDVIVTCLDERGSLVKAVAKGARKPTSTFASRLELFCVCDLLLVRGKSLDIVKEARLVEGHANLRQDLEGCACASVMAELLAKACDLETETPNLFAMSRKALAYLEEKAAPTAICCAHLLKALALLGFRPSFTECVMCGTDLAGTFSEQGRAAAFSFTEGGVLCPNCARNVPAQRLRPAVVEWSHALLFATFEEVATFDLPPQTAYQVLRFLQQWLRVQLQLDLRSLEFLFTFDTNPPQAPKSSLKQA